MPSPIRKVHFAVLLVAVMFASVLFVNCNKKESFKAVSSAVSASQAVDLSRPDIVFILLDDIGSEVPGSYGGQSYETPNIDQLSASGMRFTQCFGAPLCSPSRFMLLTGKYNFRNYTIWGKMNPNEKTVATLLRDAGYATYVGGKWQLDGGDAAIHSLGFDDYSVWLPYADSAPGSHYKNPFVYEKGAYLSKTLTKGKFGDDFYTNGILNFIDSNKNKNFFVYDAITLSHDPFVPTPDDPQFAGWVTADGSDTAYFKSMVKYMDKKVGQIVDHLKELGLYDNTMIIIAGDNGTSQYITSYNNGVAVTGGKGKTNVYGTKLPLIVSYPKLIAPGQTNTNLVDFTDFLPTIANAAGVSIPLEYGIVDGKSFYPQLLGDFTDKRKWVFDHYQPAHEEGSGFDNIVQTTLVRWANTAQYKLYDSSNKFYNIINDPFERRPITNFTTVQARIRDTLRAVIDRMHN